VAVAIRQRIHGVRWRMSTRISVNHKGIGLSVKLTALVKILAACSVLGWAFYFWVYPTHAATLFDDDFEGEYNGEWNDADSMTCDRGVTLTTDTSDHGFWSLSADRTGAAPACTDQLRTELGIYSSEVVQVSFSIGATETNITRGSLYFSDSEAPFTAFGGVKIQSEDIELSGGTTIEAGATDNTWYRVDWKIDFTTGCQTARVNGGSWATPECGITQQNVAHARLAAVGSVSTIVYIDNILLVGMSAALDGGILPPEFDNYIGGTPLSVQDVIDDYPTHDDIYGSCSIWAGIFSGSSGDGMACIWSWIQYAIIPAEGSLTGLLAATIGTLTTRWPFAYLSEPITAITEGFDNNECPLPVFLGQEFMGTTLPEFDLCQLVEDAGYTDYFLDNIWAEAMIIYAIYAGLGYMLYKRAERFLTGD